MKNRRTMIVAGSVLGLAMFAAPAVASASTPQAVAVHHIIARDFNPGDGWTAIPVQSSNGHTMASEGVGNQIMTVVSGNGTVWNTTSASAGGYKVMPNGNTGHCWQRVGDDLNIQNCSQGNDAQRFSFSGAAGNTSIKVLDGSGRFTGLFDPDTNHPVYQKTPQPGFDTGWIGPGLG